MMVSDHPEIVARLSECGLAASTATSFPAMTLDGLPVYPQRGAAAKIECAGLIHPTLG